MKNIYLMMLGIALVFSACDPVLEDKIDIGSAPNASFEFNMVDANNVVFTNTSTDDHFIVNWNIDNQVFDTTAVTVNFPFAGDYEATLTVFGKGGSGSVTKTITITQDDPNACPTLDMFITGCADKTWKLNPAAGALWVGPADNSQTWWESTAADVTDRACDWNDTYHFNSDGTYTYESKGDLWGEDYTGFSSPACYPITDLPSNLAAWGDGVHTFEIIAATSSTPAQLKVTGNGAFLGLRKPANGAEVTSPQAEIIYDIVDYRTEGGVDLLEIEVNFGGGIWRFLLAAE